MRPLPNCEAFWYSRLGAANSDSGIRGASKTFHIHWLRSENKREADPEGATPRFGICAWGAFGDSKPGLAKKTQCFEIDDANGYFRRIIRDKSPDRGKKAFGDVRGCCHG